ncbi:RHS repeat-associated core domain-containing protein [Pectobacterium polaris]|uniref:RHS repeat-associated core domain-containing protein n=1 Tax=Pectobacterium polaris TaxID=2042057 RepID=UPI001F3A692A|nr:RHS repeat-associated core domain-containing protein [Pectobacterium polaris]
MRKRGLYYNRHRYYDAESGQYLSPDPIGLAGSTRPQGYVFNPLEWVDPLGLEKKGPHSDKVPLSRNSARKLLKSRGLDKKIQRETVNSFDGQIYASQGKKGDVFDITGSSPETVSQVYVTRGSAGITAAERRANLALPQTNNATYQGKVMLTRDQVLLEGRVAPQPQWGADKVGGGWQVVTAGGKYSGATRLIP